MEHLKQLINLNEVTNQEEALKDKLQNRKIDLGTEVTPSRALLTMDYGKIFRTGNLSAITAVSGEGKSFLSELLASTFVGNDLENVEVDFGPDEKILIIDTEQSDDDVKDKIIRLNELGRIENIHLYALRNLSKEERQKAVIVLIEQIEPRFVVLDGVTDLINSVNDEEKATEYVGELLKITSKYDCHICGIIHQNEGAESSGKMRGHIGSEFTRKCDVILNVKYNKPVKEFEVKTNKTRKTSDKQFAFILENEGGITIPKHQVDSKISYRDKFLNDLADQDFVNKLTEEIFERPEVKEKDKFSKVMMKELIADYANSHNVTIGKTKQRAVLDLMVSENGRVDSSEYGNLKLKSTNQFTFRSSEKEPKRHEFDDDDLPF